MQEKQEYVEDQLSKIQTDLANALKPKEEKPKFEDELLRSDIEFLKQAYEKQTSQTQGQVQSDTHNNIFGIEREASKANALRKVKLNLKSKQEELVKNIEVRYQLELLLKRCS
ncbi:hypothetical protein MIDIC_10030 [Alphaproteobacteria bacterium]